MRLVLASASPRRADLLRAAGFDFETQPVEVDEVPRVAEPPHQYVVRLAREKAESVARARPDAVVVGADTAVVIDESILGKPDDPEEAAWMLTRLSGRTHEVLTGICVCCNGSTRAAVETTRVRFRPLSPEEIQAYASTKEPYDKAGAYAIQGAASRFVEAIEGSHSNVVGLPVARLTELLRECGLSPPVHDFD